MARAALVAAAILTLAAPLAAQDDPTEEAGSELRLLGTSSTLIEVNDTHEDEPGGEEYHKLREVLSLNLAWSDFTLGVQGQYVGYSVATDQVEPGDLDRVYEGLELRKYYLEYLKERLSLRLGTFYTSLGRGLTLYVQKNDVLGFDEPVRGGTASATLGPVELTALGGRVSEPLLQAQFNRTFEDEIYAGHALLRLPRELYLGGSYVSAELASTSPLHGDDQVDTWAVEGGGYGIAGFLDAHAEWAEMEKVERGREKDGWGRYLALSSTFGPVTLLAEAKDYWSFAYRYNTPPTAGVTTEFYDHNDVKGGRLKAGLDLAATGTLVEASWGDFDSHREPGTLGANGDAQREWYLGLQESWRDVYLEASWFERDLPDRGMEERHVVADLHLTVADFSDVVVGFDGRTEESFVRSELDRYHLTFTRSPWGSIGLRYATDEISLPPTRRDYWGGEVQVLPVPTVTFTLFVGADPGGLVCSGGQCREMPPFDGMRFEVEWRF